MFIGWGGTQWPLRVIRKPPVNRLYEVTSQNIMFLDVVTLWVHAFCQNIIMLKFSYIILFQLEQYV